MKDLFRISTDRVLLDWRSVSANPPPILTTGRPVFGRFKVTPRSPQTRLLEDTWKSEPEQVADLPNVDIGPALFEETEYQIYLRAKEDGDHVELQHRDPLIRRRLAHQEDQRVLHGVVNFRGQIGRSAFTVLVNGRPEVDFEVEIFPTKVDYESDYKQILADIQEILTGLAYEYLRSTFHLGKAVVATKPTRLEWLILLRHIVDDLVKAVRHIAQQPQRRLVRRPRTVRIERLKRVDSAVRSQVRRAIGHGALVATSVGPMRERLVEYPPESTLDTLEHRWIKHQLTEIQRVLAQILSSHKQEDGSERQRASVAELAAMERRVARMSHAEPFREAAGEVPAGFASLQLLSAPGYRETYQLCMLLKMGLRLEGEALRLSVKDLDVLYEYWVFLAMVRVIREYYGRPEGLSELFRLSQAGINVRLLQGRGQTLSFQAGKTRRISVTYNPQFDNHDATLIPQKPDILIRFEEQGWPRIQLICDAKYRIDATAEYCAQFQSPGPPRDAINVLHRYRDAILEFDYEDSAHAKPKRSVIQAAAVFPYDEHRVGEFRESRLWQSIGRLGIGAIPALPSNLEYLGEWLVSAIREGGWSLAERVIPHVVERRAIDWRIAASEPVLIGVLASANARERLDWITANNCYYHPLPKSPHRHFRVACVALYSPKTLLPVPGISHVADVEAIEVRPRRGITTPWRPRGTGDELMLLYRLRRVRPLAQLIENRDEDATTFRTDRWTSKLGLKRAKTATEIILETEPEWKLYEMLHARGTTFKLVADRVRIDSNDSPPGRAWFLLPNVGKLRYDGANGFLFVDSLDGRFHYALPELLDKLQQNVHYMRRI
jgi:predicted component of viral defense system (DUF524 family)